MPAKEKGRASTLIDGEAEGDPFLRTALSVTVVGSRIRPEGVCLPGGQTTDGVGRVGSPASPAPIRGSCPSAPAAAMAWAAADSLQP